MTYAINDHKAIGERLRLASGLKQTPPQDQVKPVEQPVYRPEEGSHLVYDYADGAFPADYSC